MAKPQSITRDQAVRALSRFCVGKCGVCRGPHGYIWHAIVKQRFGIDVSAGQCPVDRVLTILERRINLCAACRAWTGAKCDLYGGSACRWRTYMRRPGAVCLATPPKWKPESIDDG